MDAHQAGPGAERAPAGSDVADLVRATERERLRALVAADLAIADRLHADDFQLVNPLGETLAKAGYLGGIASGEIHYLVFEPADEIAVRLYGAAAAIRYRSNLHIIAGGQDVGLAHYWHTDLYELRDGRWHCVWSQATAIA